jgi:hypothetical protein
MADTPQAPVQQPIVDPQTVSLKSPEGEIYDIPHDQAAHYTQNLGFQPAAPEEVHAYDQGQKYGGLGQQVLAGVEGAAESATFGLSNAVEEGLSQAGVPGLDKESRAGRKEVNPITHGVGGLGGFLIPGAPEAKVLKEAGELAAGAAGAGRIGKLAAKYGTEFGLVQGGDEISKKINEEDPNQTAQTALTNIGLASLLGAGGAAAFGVISPLWKATKESEVGMKMANIKSRISPGSSVEQAASDVAAEAPVAEGATPQTPIQPAATEDPALSEALGTGSEKRAPGAEAPKSFEQMARMVDDGLKTGGTIEMPQAKAVRDALEIVGTDLQYPPTALHMESLENPSNYKEFQVTRQMPGKEGDIIRNYDALSKSGDVVPLTDRYISEVAPQGTEVSGDAIKSGNKANEFFKQQIGEQESAITPDMNKLFSIKLGEQVNDAASYLDRVKQAFPSMAEAITSEVKDGAERYTLKPYLSKYGLSRPAYRSLEGAVDSLNSGVDNFRQLRDIREAMRIKADETSEAKRQSLNLMARMMDHIQDRINMAPELEGSPEVRSTFARWAKNEQQKAVIRDVFGASFGSREMNAISEVKPEKILDKMFSNTATINAAKAILKPEQYQELLAEYLAKARKEFTSPEGAFSATKFGTFLKKEAPELATAFKENPQGLQKIQAISTIGRVFPDASPANPSHTAPTIAQAIKNAMSLDSVRHPIHAITNIFTHDLPAILEHKKEVAKLEATLSGSKEAKAAALNQFAKASDRQVNPSALQNMTTYFDHLIKGETLLNKAAKNIFIRGAEVLPSHVLPDAKSREKLDKRLKDLRSDNSSLMNLGGDTGHYLPGHAAALGQTAANATNYLNSLRPSEDKANPLDSPKKPDPVAMSNFNRALDIAQQPAVVLQRIKDGNLNSKDLTHLHTLYPALYNKYQQLLMDHVATQLDKGEPIPYQTKMALSLFMHRPLTTSMTPQGILQAQATFQEQGQQGQQQQPPQSGSKHNTTGLNKVAATSRTASQSREMRSSKV